MGALGVFGGLFEVFHIVQLSRTLLTCLLLLLRLRVLAELLLVGDSRLYVIWRLVGIAARLVLHIVLELLFLSLLLVGELGQLCLRDGLDVGEFALNVPVLVE